MKFLEFLRLFYESFLAIVLGIALIVITGVWTWDLLGQLQVWPGLNGLNDGQRHTFTIVTAAAALLFIVGLLPLFFDFQKKAHEFRGATKQISENLQEATTGIREVTTNVEEKIRGYIVGPTNAIAEINNLCANFHEVVFHGSVDDRILDVFEEAVARNPSLQLEIHDTTFYSARNEALACRAVSFHSGHRDRLKYWLSPGPSISDIFVGTKGREARLLVLFGGLSASGESFGLTTDLRSDWKVEAARLTPRVRLNIEGKLSELADKVGSFASGLGDLEHGIFRVGALKVGDEAFFRFWQQAQKYLESSRRVKVSWAFANGGRTLRLDPHIRNWLQKLKEKVEGEATFEVDRYIFVSFHAVRENKDKIRDELMDVASSYFPVNDRYRVWYLDTDQPVIQNSQGDSLVFYRDKLGECYQITNSPTIMDGTEFMFDGHGSEAEKKCTRFFDNLEKSIVPMYRGIRFCVSSINEIV